MSSALSVYYKNYLVQLEEAKKYFEENGTKPRLLLHACCGPCSSACLEQLCEYFDLSILFYNPNIYPEEEYCRRRDELKRFVADFLGKNAPNIIEENYNSTEFYSAIEKVPDFAALSEKGERCRVCYSIRMQKCAQYAQNGGYNFFTTTLSISPHKDAEKINGAGVLCQNELQQKYGENAAKYLFADFKKKNGFKRSLELSVQFGLYRQDYCGCVFSMQNQKQAVLSKNESL